MNDVCKVGDELEVMVIAIDEQDRVKLSRRAAQNGNSAGEDDDVEDE